MNVILLLGELRITSTEMEETLKIVEETCYQRV